MLIVTATQWFLWALCAVVAPLAEGIITEQDPNTRYMCQGTLSDFAACQCREDESELACVNAQFVDTDVFLHVNNHYRHLRKVTFHGNNFQDLPDSALFGSHDHKELQVLNISANYIVNLNHFALKGMPNLRVLDLSYNEIVLKEENVDFLTHTSKLRELYLRRAFTTVVNRTEQFDILMRMFANAKLEHLEVLDLSYNYFNNVPYELPCPFPNLRTLDLKQNLLKTLSINTTCLSDIDKLDLSRNHFRELDKPFREQMANHLPDESLMMRNSYFCDCNSREYIQWIRSTNKIREKGNLLCARASPEEYTGVRLVEVPLQQLDCAKSLTQSAPSAVVRSFGHIIATVLSLIVPFLMF